MSYKALYLKYRPQTFEEVAGQSVIVRTLKNALANDKLAHAYLFAGPRGTGKTSMARLLAKALNCEEGVGHQCNHCSNCSSISDGSHPDVVEIDAASNNGVDQVRDLIEKVTYAPLKGRYKVYIIDEVHMMTDAAFNALLKTIEEPPEDVIFILCTTEPYKVLPTILSRCQRFDFGKIPEDDMEKKLIEILQNENATYETKALRLVMKLADGGMRDALSILDQVLAFSSSSLKEEDVLAIYGLASDDEKIDLLLSLRDGDVARVVGKSESYLAGGIDIRRLVAELITFLKDLLIYEKTVDSSLMDELSVEHAKLLSKKIGPKDCNSMLNELISAQNDFKNVSDIRSLFELTLLRIATRQDNDTNRVQISEPIPSKPAQKAEFKPTPKVEPKPVPKMEPTPAPIQKEPMRVVKNDNEAPDWLFEEDKPIVEEKPFSKPQVAPAPQPAPKPIEPIDISKITRPNIASDGPTLTLSDEQLINIMVLADKNEKVALINNWRRFDALRLDPVIGPLATLLFEGKPYALCKEALIITYRYQVKAKKANIVSNQLPMQELLATILGRKVFIYAIDPEVQSRVQKDFFSKQQLSSLPKKDEVELKLPM